MAECLTGKHGFYDEVFESMGVPYEPVRWRADVNALTTREGEHARLAKAGARADADHILSACGATSSPTSTPRRRAAALVPRARPAHLRAHHLGLPRRFVADGLAALEVASLDEILTSCATLLPDARHRVTLHIQDPVQKTLDPRAGEACRPP